jgi:hypothetical protein
MPFSARQLDELQVVADGQHGESTASELLGPGVDLGLGDASGDL